jgi:hypothetical protein
MQRCGFGVKVRQEPSSVSLRQPYAPRPPDAGPFFVGPLGTPPGLIYSGSEGWFVGEIAKMLLLKLDFEKMSNHTLMAYHQELCEIAREPDERRLYRAVREHVATLLAFPR